MIPPKEDYQLILSIRNENQISKKQEYFVEYSVTSESLAVIAGKFFKFSDQKDIQALEPLFTTTLATIDFKKDNLPFSYRIEMVKKKKTPFEPSFFYSQHRGNFVVTYDLKWTKKPTGQTGTFFSPPQLDRNRMSSANVILLGRSLFTASNITKIEASSSIETLSVTKKT